MTVYFPRGDDIWEVICTTSVKRSEASFANFLLNSLGDDSVHGASTTRH